MKAWRRLPLLLLFAAGMLLYPSSAPACDAAPARWTAEADRDEAAPTVLPSAPPSVETRLVDLGPVATLARVRPPEFRAPEPRSLSPPRAS